MTNYYSIIPFIVSFVLLMRGKKTYVAMLTAAFTGIVINYLLAASHTLPLFTLQNWFDDVVKGNISTIVSIYLLVLLMNIITHSKIIVCANQWLEKHAFSNSIFITIVPVLSVLLSQDDYLSCLSTGTIASKFATRYSIPKYYIATIINLTAVTACCISPISSWSPVITGALKKSGIPEHYSVLSASYNIVALLFLISVIKLCYNAAKSNKKLRTAYIANTEQINTISNKGIKLLVAIILILPCTYLFLCKVMNISSPLIGASILSIFLTIILLYQNKMIDKPQICVACKETLREMTSLSFSLISIWTFVMVCDTSLGFNVFITQCYKVLHTPKIFIPAILFLIAAIFSFLTGSSYGSFNLFIPLAAQLSADYSNTFKLLSVAAAISGSLFAIFSYSSDTTALCAQSTTSKIQEIRKVQFPLAKRILIIGIIGYILLAKCINQPSGYLLTILCIVLCYTFSLSTHKFTKRHYIVVYKAYIKLQTINLTYNGNPKLIKLKEYAKHYWKRITCKKSLYCFRIL